MPRFRDIPQITPDATYVVDVSWTYLEDHMATLANACPVLTDPDFQRAHVWTEAQQIAYVEFKLRGGMGSNEIRWNHPFWMRGNIEAGSMELVDGKQRLEAVRRFMRGEIPAFGYCIGDYEDRPDMLKCRFRFMVNTLPTRADVLRWYLDINAGGVAHTDEEIARVRALLEAEAA